MRLLLINANTTTAVTELCAAAARKVAAPDTQIVPVTGAFGAAIIESRAENAVAAHALLDALAANLPGADAVLIAVSYDTGLAAAREVAGIPVVGITQASLTTAGLMGQRIGLVTFGTPWLYRELAASYGFADRLAGIETITAGARDAYSNPAVVLEAVTAAARRLVAEAGAEAVVLCGAAMAGMAATVAPALPVPVVDGVSCGVPLCEMLARGRYRGAARTLRPGASGVGLSAALAGVLYGRG